MIIYHIQGQKRRDDGTVVTFIPELTASEYAASQRKRYLLEHGFADSVCITYYDVKTQGVNFNTIATVK